MEAYDEFLIGKLLFTVALSPIMAEDAPNMYPVAS